MRVLTLIWIGLVALLVLGTAACFVARAPVIAPGSGDDLGAVVKFLSYEPEGSEIGPTGFSLTRQGDGRYELGLYDPDDPNAPAEPTERPWMLVDLQRIGDRDGAPVVVMQAELPEGLAISLERKYGIGFFTLRADGVGVMAVPDCGNPGLAALAETHQVRLSCFTPIQSPYFLNLDAATSADRLWALLSDGLKTGVIQWEDTLGLSLLDASGL